MGSFLSRVLLMASGYAYPAYECFKAVEKNEAEIEQLRFWCQYWILIAILTVCERIGDTFVSWLPFYSEAKLAFVVYLWHPKWKGTTYVYDSFVRPYVVKHETEIDRNLTEIKVKAGEVGNVYWHRAKSYGQTMIIEVLKSFSSQKSSSDNHLSLADQLLLQQSFRKAESVALRSQAFVTKPLQLEQPLPSQSNERMVLAQSCVETTTSQSSLSRFETERIQSMSSDQEQTPYNYKEEAVFKRHRIWRIFKTSATAH